MFNTFNWFSNEGIFTSINTRFFFINFRDPRDFHLVTLSAWEGFSCGGWEELIRRFLHAFMLFLREIERNSALCVNCVIFVYYQTCNNLVYIYISPPEYFFISEKFPLSFRGFRFLTVTDDRLKINFSLIKLEFFLSLRKERRVEAAGEEEEREREGRSLCCTERKFLLSQTRIYGNEINQLVTSIWFFLANSMCLVRNQFWFVPNNN